MSKFKFNPFTGELDQDSTNFVRNDQDDSSTGKITAQGFNASNQKIGSVASPSDSLDAANKIYVDDSIPGIPVAGDDTQVQFNDGGANFGADPTFTFNKTNNTLQVPEIIASSGLVIGVGEAGKDYNIEINGENSSGLLTWKEDEDYWVSPDEFRVDGDLQISGISYQQHATSQPTRILDKAYQNTTGHPIIVQGTLRCFAGDDAVNITAFGVLFADAGSPPTTEIGRAGIDNMAQLAGLPSTALISYHQFYGVVGSNEWYMISGVTSGASSSVTLQPGSKWNEVNF